MNVSLSTFFKSVREVRLLAVFILGFSIPIALVLYFTGVFNKDNDAIEPQDVFPQALDILSQNTYFKVAHADSLVPVKGSDYLVLGWFNLRRLPAPDQKFVLFSKLDVTDKLGYAMALTRDSNGIRPLVYWADSHRVNGRLSGRWFDFSEIPIHAKSWFLVALSFHNDKLLGLHLALEKPGDPGKYELHLAGGYEVAELELPMGNAELISGTYQDRSWRGAIGPFAVISEPNLSASLKDNLKRLLKDPIGLGHIFSPEAIQLWLPDIQKDISSFKRPVEVVKPKKRKDEPEEEQN